MNTIAHLEGIVQQGLDTMKVVRSLCLEPLPGHRIAGPEALPPAKDIPVPF